MSGNSVERLTKRSSAARLMNILHVLFLGHYITSSIYGYVNFWLGVLNTVLSTIAGASALSQLGVSNSITGVLAILVAILSALLTFLNPGERGRFHHEAGVKFEPLYVRVSELRDILSDESVSVEVTGKELGALEKKYSELREAYPLPNWSWLLTQRLISS